MRTFAPAAVALALVALVAACHGKAEFPSEHRQAAEACPADPKFTEPWVANQAAAPPATDAPLESCENDAGCKKGQHGRCHSGGHGPTHCVYDACMSDGDCRAGTTCACNRDGNTCVAANCRSDAECGGLGCSPTEWRTCNDYGGIVGYYCHTKKDACTDSNDCGGPTSSCQYSPESARWICVDHGRCVG